LKSLWLELWWYSSNWTNIKQFPILENLPKWEWKETTQLLQKLDSKDGPEYYLAIILTSSDYLTFSLPFMTNPNPLFSPQIPVHYHPPKKKTR
jgi:hypothetical protein